MTTLGFTLTAAGAVVAAGCCWAGWAMAKRPLWVWRLAARQALKRAGLKRRIVPSPAGPQTVWVGGTGPLLILVHGAGDHAGTWAKVAPVLIRNHTLVIPDLAGHGESAPSAGIIEASAIVAGLEAVLAWHCQGRRATLVGNSLGAWMALVLAQRHPEWVEKAVAVNGGPLPFSGEPVNLLPTTREEARKTMSQLRDPGNPPVPDFVLDDMIRQSRTSALARFSATAATTMGDWLMDEARLATVQVPVDLVWGTADALMPLSYAERMRAVLPGSRLFPVERCGHIPQAEAPGRFLEALGKALQA